jgi:hypothetical protein
LRLQISDAVIPSAPLQARVAHPRFFVSGLPTPIVWLVVVAALVRPADAQTPTETATLTPTSLATRTLFPTFTQSPTPTPTPTRTPPSPFLADANCDRVGSAADTIAAIIVSDDATRFADCLGANSFRGHPLSDNDFLALFNDLFSTFAVPFTPTPTASRTVTRTPSRTGTPTPTPRVSATPTATASLTTTPTLTATLTPAPPSSTRTPSRTLTPTPTHPPSPTPTPTGRAYQLSGQWAANWGNQLCFLLGQPFVALQDTTYRVTAVDGTLDIELMGGERIGRGLDVDASGTVHTTFVKGSGHVCGLTGVEELFRFDYTFTFNTNGTGTAMATWSFGENTNCESCRVTDSATLVRVGGPQ